MDMRLDPCAHSWSGIPHHRAGREIHTTIYISGTGRFQHTMRLKTPLVLLLRARRRGAGKMCHEVARILRCEFNKLGAPQGQRNTEDGAELAITCSKGVLSWPRKQF